MVPDIRRSITVSNEVYEALRVSRGSKHVVVPGTLEDWGIFPSRGETSISDVRFQTFIWHSIVTFDPEFRKGVLSARVTDYDRVDTLITLSINHFSE